MLKFSNHNMLQNDNYCKFYLPLKDSVTSEQSRGKSETHTVTNNGGVAITTVGGKSCAGFNGSEQYLTVPDSDDFILGDYFTINFDIYPNNTPSVSETFLRKSDLSDNDEFWIQTQINGKLAALFGGTGNFFLITNENVIIGGSWYNCCFVRSGVNMFFYLDGQLVASDEKAGVSITNTAQPFIIGSLSSDSDRFSGYIRNPSIHKGIARFTRNFTPQDRLI